MIKFKKALENFNRFRLLYLFALFLISITVRIYVPFFAIVAFSVLVFGIIYESDLKGIYYLW